MNLIEETLSHFKEGAKSVRAYTNDKTYIITKSNDSQHFVIALEEPGFPKTKFNKLDQIFTDEVFGIEAKY